MNCLILLNLNNPFQAYIRLGGMYGTPVDVNVDKSIL